MLGKNAKLKECQDKAAASELDEVKEAERQHWGVCFNESELSLDIWTFYNNEVYNVRSDK